MKRQIKFRGKRTDNGELIFGDLLSDFLLDGLTEDRLHARIRRVYKIRDFQKWFPVESDSIAQLVGYDKDGREVYEGDKLVSVDNGAVWVAALNPTVTLPKYEHLESSNLELSGLKLQENQS